MQSYQRRHETNIERDTNRQGWKENTYDERKKKSDEER